MHNWGTSDFSGTGNDMDPSGTFMVWHIDPKTLDSLDKLLPETVRQDERNDSDEYKVTPKNKYELNTTKITSYLKFKELLTDTMFPLIDLYCRKTVLNKINHHRYGE